MQYIHVKAHVPETDGTPTLTKICVQMLADLLKFAFCPRLTMAISAVHLLIIVHVS